VRTELARSSPQVKPTQKEKPARSLLRFQWTVAGAPRPCRGAGGMEVGEDGGCDWPEAEPEWPCKLGGSLQKLGSRSTAHISEVPHRDESNLEVLCKYSDRDQSKPGGTL
jgi:hypothetical protein